MKSKLVLLLIILITLSSVVYADNDSNVDLSAYSSKNWIKNGGHSWLEFTGDSTVAIILDSGKSKIEFEVESLRHDAGNFIYYNTNYDGRDTIVRFEFRSAVKGESDNCLLLVVLGNDVYKFYEFDKYMSLTNTSAFVMINDGLAPKSFFNPEDIPDNSISSKYQGVWKSNSNVLTIDGDTLEIVQPSGVENYTARGKVRVEADRTYETCVIQNEDVITSLRFTLLDDSNTTLEVVDSDWVKTVYYKVGSDALDDVSGLNYEEVDTVDTKFMGEWVNSAYRLSIDDSWINLRSVYSSDEDYVIKAHSELTHSDSDNMDYLVFASTSRLNAKIDELRLRIINGDELYVKWGNIYEGTFSNYVEPPVYVEPQNYVEPYTRLIDGRTVTDINMRVFTNGDEVNFVGSGPVNVDGATMVPARAIFEALRFEINWNGSTKTVTFEGRDTGSPEMHHEASVTLGQVVVPVTSVDGADSFNLSVPAMLVDGRTVVPLRDILEYYGYDVAWSNEGTHQQVLITPAK